MTGSGNLSLPTFWSHFSFDIIGFLSSFIFLFEQIESSKLFSNVEEIYEVNLEFWTEHLSKVVENVSTLPF